MPDPASAGVTLGGRGRGWLGRATSQAGLILALLAVFAMCSAVAGAGALLLTNGNENALSDAVALADGSERDGAPDVTTVYVNGATGEGAVPPDAATLTPLVRRTLASTVAPYQAQVSLWTTSPTMFLDGADVKRAYLLDADTITANASLRTGAWPTAPTGGGSIPVAVPATTAEALGVGIGGELRLSSERGDAQDAGRSFRLVVTGTFTPAGTPAWDRDLLKGRGYDPDYLWLPTYGPFVVAPGTLEASAAPVDRVVAVLDPELGGDARGVPGLTQRLDALATQLRDSAGPSVGSVRVWSALGATFAGMEAELGVTDTIVLAVLVLVLALGAATTALLARALLSRRGAELTLLRDRGASGSQLVRGAADEALGLAVVAAAVATPLALGAYTLASPVAAVPSGSAATGIGQAFVPSLLAGAVLPALVLVIATMREQPRGRRLPISGTLARSGLDVMAALLAVVAYLQLRTHAPQPGIDPLLVVAPAACVLAVAALATRLLPLLTRAADRAARRGKAFVLPMAAWHVARGGAVRGTFLVVLAAAVCTMGVTFLATWPGSQDDQAAALVGADLVVEQPGGPGTAQELASATGGTATPVADRAVVLGSRPEGVKALALDGTLAGRMLTSRPPAGESWPAVMAELAPAEASAPLVVPAETQDVTISGQFRAATVLPGLPAPVVTATPTLVLADEAGVTTTRTGSAVLLDGGPHPIRYPLPGEPELPAGRWQVVAVDLLLADQTDADLIGWGTNDATVQLSLTVAGSSPSSDGSWSAGGDDGPGEVRPLDVSVGGDTVRATFSYSVLGLSWQDSHLRLLSFPATTEVPVALTADLAGELGLATGDRIGLTWGTTSLTARVVRTVPYIPAHVREAALLTDLRSLQRALLSAGDLEPATDAWWVAGPQPGAAEALRSLGRGPVTDRTEEATALRDGPLRAPLPLAWQLAIAAAIALAVTGSGANAAAEARSRGTTLARVRALGLSKREALASQVAQDLAVTTAGVVLGGICGALLGGLLIPLLVTSPAGEQAVPAVNLAWSGGFTASVLAVILVGALLAGIPATLAVVGRSTVAALRAGEAP